MSDAVIVGFAVIIGLAIGSFLAVVSYRVPRHESVSHPRSHCAACGTPLHWFELVPVVSWLALRGRCRTCHAHIPARDLLIELACGLVLGLVAGLVVA